MRAALLLFFALFACNCDREAPPPQPEQRADESADAPRSAIVTESDFIRNLREQATAGDPDAMITLGQAYQAQGAFAEARQWFEKARAAGSTLAEQALAELDQNEAIDRAAATRPLDAPASTEPASTSPTAAASPAADEPRAPRDPSKVSWEEITASYDVEAFMTDTKTDPSGRFLARSVAKDETMLVAAGGPTPDAITGVQIIVRVRNRQRAEESLRVRQAGAICANVTRDNVSRAEVAEWVKRYLASEQALPTVYRGGWQIVVTGPRAEGRPDGRSAIGDAVKIELSR